MNSREPSSFRRKSAKEIRGGRKRAHDRLIRGYDWFSDYAAELVGAFAVAAGTTSGWVSWSHPLAKLLLVATFVLTLVAALLAVQRSHRISTLSDEVKNLEIESNREKEALRDLLERAARRFLEEAGYWDSGTCRLSIYGHVDDRFFLICRVSRNPALAKPGRAWYPDDQGQIQVIWEKTAVDESGWQRQTAQKKAIESGMPEDVAKNLTMHPRGMTGQRVDNHMGEETGIILLESREPHELDDAMDKMNESVVYQTLADSVAASENVFEPLSQHSS